jgi:GxxExxY protein
MASRRGGFIEGSLTRSVIGAFYDVYNRLGFGFVERVYSLALERELAARGHRVSREEFVTIYYRGEPLVDQRLDMVVDRKLILEIKSTWQLPASAARQLYNYLRATEVEVGLLLHFGAEPKFYRFVSTNAPPR